MLSKGPCRSSPPSRGSLYHVNMGRVTNLRLWNCLFPLLPCTLVANDKISLLWVGILPRNEKRKKKGKERKRRGDAPAQVGYSVSVFREILRVLHMRPTSNGNAQFSFSTNDGKAPRPSASYCAVTHTACMRYYTRRQVCSQSCGDTHNAHTILYRSSTSMCQRTNMHKLRAILSPKVLPSFFLRSPL
ncbi:hypothetical protein BGZ63DRAFT_109873 [Mariannaea sp. PMI_226]|nr:hypothetical protein BGZ63DRAFT_109873 [Mariannaea sp. PMI_226]